MTFVAIIIFDGLILLLSFYMTYVVDYNSYEN